jgi:hypothetical protein
MILYAYFSSIAGMIWYPCLSVEGKLLCLQISQFWQLLRWIQNVATELIPFQVPVIKKNFVSRKSNCVVTNSQDSRL